MTTDKHTPGPWEARGSDVYMDGRCGEIAARVAWTHCGEVLREQADAHLIAAAPDMLEALGEALLYINNDETRDLVRAAIKKARGEK